MARLAPKAGIHCEARPSIPPHPTMEQKRVLIVEPDNAYALSLASLYREDDGATARLPVVLYSSETPPEALAEHARTAWAANGYLAMPLDTAALRILSGRILAAAEPLESADDAVLEDAVEEIAPAPAEADAAPAAGEGASAPPPVPRRVKRSVLTDEDRLFVDRVFRSIAERREDLLAGALDRRPPPRRDLLQSPEGRLQLLREDLKARRGGPRGPRSPAPASARARATARRRRS